MYHKKTNAITKTAGPVKLQYLQIQWYTKQGYKNGNDKH